MHFCRLLFVIVFFNSLSLSASSVRTRVIQTVVATATADTTTTSTTDVALNSMTGTPGSGSFLVLFDSSVAYTAEGQVITFSLYVNGVQVASTARLASMGNSSSGAISGTQTPVGITWPADVSAGQTAEIRWKTSTGTATAHQRNLAFIKIR